MVKSSLLYMEERAGGNTSEEEIECQVSSKCWAECQHCRVTSGIGKHSSDHLSRCRPDVSRCRHYNGESCIAVSSRL